VELNSGPRKRRVVDTSNGDARRAIQATLDLFPGWRADLAAFDARVERNYTAADRELMLQRCRAIGDGVQAARVSLIESLMDAPPRVVGNSRIADVERALDDIEAAVRRLRKRLGH
jgi:hypothetical protein